MLKKQFNTYIFLLIIFNFWNSAYSQNATDSIVGKFENYFRLDREKIHLQFSKNHYFTNEDINFQGYCFHLQKSQPYLKTSNVMAVLYNEKGEKIDEKLLFASNGYFDGTFNSKVSLPTGIYYVHVFTNWMKNFAEDESSLFKIRLINPNELKYEKEIANNSQVDVQFYPEGGKIISETSNIVGIKVSDCRGNALPISEVILINSDGKKLKNININKFGHGKFELLPNEINCKIKINSEGILFEQPLPASSDGISLEVNSYSLKDKIAIKIKANAKTVTNFQQKPLYLVTNQFGDASVSEIILKPNQLETLIFIDPLDLPSGVNTVRIVDEKMNLIAERLFFNTSEVSKISLEKIKTSTDSVSLKGIVNLSDAVLGISVVPEQSKISDENSDIQGTFLLNPFLMEDVANSRYYFEDISIRKKYELDLLLLNQRGTKYTWENIKNIRQKETFEFDNGFAVKGTISNKLENREKSKVILISESMGLFSAINEKNEFSFENLTFADSTQIKFSLIDHKNRTIQLKGYSQIINNRRSFNKPLRIKNRNWCEVKREIVNVSKPEFTEDLIQLSEIEIQKDVTPKFKYNSDSRNRHMRGHKIGAAEAGSTLLEFLRLNGFETGFHDGHYHIYSRKNPGGGGATPAIYINNVMADEEFVTNMIMSQIDEIYLDNHTMTTGRVRHTGIIRIYAKASNELPSRINYMKLDIDAGFAKIKPFKNVLYNSTEDIGFSNYGLIDWIPNILTNNGEAFSFDIPKMNQKKVNLKIEGFSSEGKLISEIKTIELE